MIVDSSTEMPTSTFKLKYSLNTIKWPCELIGRNSVKPCKKQKKSKISKIDSSKLIILILSKKNKMIYY